MWRMGSFPQASEISISVSISSLHQIPLHQIFVASFSFFFYAPGLRFLWRAGWATSLEKNSTILTKSKSQDFHAEFSGTRGMLYCLCILKYVLVCLGMAVEQPLENQCQRRTSVSTALGICQYVSVLWGTLGYSCVLKGTWQYIGFLVIFENEAFLVLQTLENLW